ncbi:hypothetical protein ACIQFZ_18090 [Streptomyces sp. NPDC093064]|uniref:hypothetical protein n=1 Tax=Streptomyces sp. NPDC093064 TaxID=3366020 RepID=UPI0038019F5E
MPSCDRSRARCRLADRHIAVFAHLLDGETSPEELWESLVDLQRIGPVGEEGELALCTATCSALWRTRWS